MKTITWADVLAFNPCTGTQEKYAKLFPKDSELTIEKIIKTMTKHDHYVDANWLIVQFMFHKESVKYAIFAAKQVLGIYEKKYPKDDRPRKSIEAAKAWIKDPCGETKNAAHATNVAAYAVANAAADAKANAATNSTYAAANAAYAVAKAAYAVADAAADVKANATADAKANAAYAAANAAYAVADAAYAVANAAYAAAYGTAYAAAKATDDAAKIKLQEKILKFGIKLIKQRVT